MCGIAGILGTKEKTSDTIQHMVDIITHRGPDDQGILVENTFAFGMRRLSIIDLGGGKQPISNEDGTVTVVFNGEIYNHQELRPNLEKSGHIFKTHSDTEGLVHLYEDHGPAMLNMLRGMFGFAIYDQKKSELFIARDYFGIKPIYYRIDNGKFMSFGSEIKSLLEDTSYKPEVNDAAVYNYLAFQYNPLEETMFKGIFRLLPGHYMVVNLNDGSFKIEKYWQYQFTVDSNNNSKQNEEKSFSEKISKTIEDSVAHHMISDVPVGAFLSGGIDSAIIVTLVQELRKKAGAGSVSTFTIGFDKVSEHGEAKVVADKLGTDHHEITIEADEYFKELPKIAWHFDEPVADPSAVALYFLSREARKKVKVVLSGEGSDELFGGYNIYREPFALKVVAWMPKFLQKSLIRPLTRLPFSFFGKNYLTRTLIDIRDRYIGNAFIFKPTEQDKIWKKAGKPERILLTSSYDQVATEPDSRKMQFIDINYWLPGDILAKADKMTMAHSLELRVPFLDIEVAKLSETIPDRLKYKNGMTKYILRKAFEGVLPQETSERKKLGFPTPIRHWLREQPNAVMKIIRENKYLNDTMDMKYIEQLATEHIQNMADHSRKIYILLMFALWYDVFIKTKA
ncbi:MAG: asparagine synthase (glutamine-hydrolyzing) [Patescibacteria group bacterium]